MLSLLMDTSNQYLMVALYQDGKCLESIQELGSKKQSENAIPYLSSLLEKYKLELLDIDEMIITRGPGSYTGERVAMTIAKTLSVISNVKIKTISSLAAYAGMKSSVSVIDARSHKVFVCAYQDGQALIDEQLVDVDDFEDFMKDYPSFDVVGQSEVVSHPHQDVDLAKNMYLLSRNIEAISNVDALVPRYLKDVEAKNMLVRAMDLDDLDRVVELEQTLFTSSWTKSDFIYEIFENQFSHNYVLEKDHQIVGYVGLWITYEHSQITTIGIDPTYQRQGLGRVLMNAMIELALSHQCEVMSLEVRVSNHKAISLYESLGFENQAIRKNYYQDNHEDAYLMVKRLEDTK